MGFNSAFKGLIVSYDLEGDNPGYFQGSILEFMQGAGAKLPKTLARRFSNELRFSQVSSRKYLKHLYR